MSLGKIHVVTLLILIIVMSLAVYFVYTASLANAQQYCVTLIIDPKNFNMRSNFSYVINIYMVTPDKLHTYLFVANNSKTSKLHVDLTAALMEWRRFYDEEKGLLQKLSTRPLPTLTVFMTIYDDEGNNYIANFVYTPFDYYYKYKKMKYTDAFNLAYTNPYEAFKDVDIYVIPSKPVMIHEGGKPAVISSKDLMIAEEDKNTSLKMSTFKLVYSLGDTFTAVKPELEELYNSRYQAPSTWFQRVEGAPSEEAVDEIWYEFAIRYSRVYYYAKDVYTRDEVVSIASEYLHTGVYSMDEYIYWLGTLVGYYTLSWKDSLEQQYFTWDLPIIGVNVTYNAQKLLDFQITASITKWTQHLTGFSYKGYLVFGKIHQTMITEGNYTIIQPTDEKTTAFLYIPVTYRLLGDGIFIDFTLKEAIINGKEYWVVDPVFAIVPLYTEIGKNIDKMHCSRNYNPYLLENITWNGISYTIFEDYVTTIYPIVYSNSPGIFFEDKMKPAGQNLGTRAGLITSIYYNWASKSIDATLSIKELPKTASWILSVIASDFSFMEFNAHKAAINLILFGFRESLYNDTSYVTIKKLTIQQFPFNDYYRPLMIMYYINVSSPNINETT